MGQIILYMYLSHQSLISSEAPPSYHLWSLQCFPDLAGLKGRLALREGEEGEGRIREQRGGGRH